MANGVTLTGGICLLGLLSVTAEAWPEPVTYAGTLGRSEIVVEFTDDPASAGAAPAGRYFYLSKGVDIPLQAAKRSGGSIVLDEEGVCDEKPCFEGGAAPVTAEWRLAPDGPDGALSGTWKGAKTLPVALRRVGARPAPPDLPEGPLGLYQFSDQLAWEPDGGPIAAEVSPYDRLRFDAPMKAGRLEGWPGAQFRYVVDPRTKFRFPRLAGAPDSAVNRTLQGRQERTGLSALDCVALQYAGFQDPDAVRGTAGGTLGGFDETTVEVTYLSPRLLSWTESGSIYCGGAHPDNFSLSYNMDVPEGRVMKPADIFKDWTDDQPGQALVDMVRERRAKPDTETDKADEAECGIDDLIATNLAPHFRRKGNSETVVFALENLPHAIGACARDILELPVSEVRPFLTPRAAGLLPALPRGG